MWTRYATRGQIRTDGRFPGSCQATAYYVAAEAFTNAPKYADLAWAAPPGRGPTATVPVSARASLPAPRLPALSSFLPAGIDAFVPMGMEAIVSSQLRGDGHTAASGRLSRLAAGQRLRGVHPQRGDGVLHREAQRQRDQHRSQA